MKKVEDTKGGKRIRDTKTGQLHGSPIGDGKTNIPTSNEILKQIAEASSSEKYGAPTETVEHKQKIESLYSQIGDSHIEAITKILAGAKVGYLYRAFYTTKARHSLPYLADIRNFGNFQRWGEEGTLTEEIMERLQTITFEHEGLPLYLDSLEVFPARSKVVSRARDPKPKDEFDWYPGFIAAIPDLLVLGNEVASDPDFSPAIAHLNELVQADASCAEFFAPFFTERVLDSPAFQAKHFTEGRELSGFITIGTATDKFQEKLSPQEYALLRRFHDKARSLGPKTDNELEDKYVGKPKFWLESDNPDVIESENS